MAKRRKRLNPRVMIVMLVLLGLAAAAGIVTFIMNMPKDPQPFIVRGNQAFEEGNFAEATRQYRQAIANGASSAEIYLKNARAHYELFRDPEISEVDRRTHAATVHDQIGKAIRQDPQNVEALQWLVDLAWGEAMSAAFQGQPPDYERFKDTVTSLIEVDPDNALAYYRRGQAYRGLMPRNQTAYSELAMADFERAIELDPENVSFLIDGKISLLVQQEKKDEALKAFEVAINNNPEDSYLRIRYGTLLYEMKDKDQALEQLMTAIDITQDQEKEKQLLAQVALAGYYQAEGQLEEASEALEVAEQIDPTDLRIYDLQKRILEQMGEFDQARDTIRRGVAVAEGIVAGHDETEISPERRTGFILALIDLRYSLADAIMDSVARNPAMDQQERAGRLQETRDLLAMIEQEQDTVQILSRYYKILGRLALEDRDLDDALVNLKKAYDSPRESGQFDEHAARLLIDVYLRKGQPKDAMAIIDEYLRQPGLGRSLDVRLAKARVLMKYRDYGQAKDIILAVLNDTQGKYAPAQDLLTRLQIETNEIRIEQLDPNVELTAADVNLLMVQAARAWAAGDWDEAISGMEQLHQRVPEHLGVTLRLSQMYLVVGRTEESENLLVEAVKVYPDNEDLKFYLQLLQEPSAARRHEMQLERAEKLEDPLKRAIALADITALSTAQDTNQTEEQRALKVIDYLQQAAEIDPAESNCLERMFSLCLGMELWDKAEWAVEKCTQANIDGFNGRFYQARLYVAQNEIEAAIDILKRILIDHPGVKQVSMLLGNCYANQQDYEQAANIFETLFDADRSYAPPAIEMIRIMLIQGKIYEAENWINQAYQLAPFDPFVKNQYFRLQEDVSSGVDIEDLIANREQMVRTSPRNIENRYRLARLYERAERYRDAEAQYRWIYANHVDPIMGATILLDYYNRTNQTEPLDAIISDLLDRVEDKAIVHVLWGQFLAGQSLNQGLAKFDRAIELAPSDVRPYEAKAALQARHGQWGDAADTMDRCLEVFRSSPEYDEATALLYVKRALRYRVENNEFDFAKQAVAELQKEHPDDLEVLTLAGVLAARDGDNERAMEIFTQVLQVDSGYVPAKRERAKLYVVNGELGKAREELEAAIKLASNDNDLAMQLADVYYQMRDRAGAQFIYEKILDRDPSYEPAIRSLLIVYFEREDWPRVEGLLADVQRRFPRQPFFHVIESEMWAKRGNPAKSLEALANSTRAAPDSTLALRIYLNALIEQRYYDQALATIDRYIGRGPEFGPWVKAAKARIFALRGDTAKADVLFAEAVSEAKQAALEEAVEQVKATYGNEQAVDKLLQWLDLRPDDWHMRSLVGVLCSAVGRLEDSRRLLEGAIPLATESLGRTAVYTSLGQTYYLLADYENSEKAYLEAIKAAEGADRAVPALNNLAYMYTQDLNEPQKALPYAKRAAELSPQDPNVQDTYGWTLAKLKRYDEAVRYLNRSVNLEQLPAALVHLAYVYEQTGQVSQAEKLYRQAEARMINQQDSELYREAQEGAERCAQMSPQE